MLLDKLFFRPTIVVIQQENNEREQLLDEINNIKEDIRKKELYKQTQWHEFQNVFAAALPKIIKPEKEIKPVWGITEIPAIESKEQQKLAHQLAEFLIHKVDYVH